MGLAERVSRRTITQKVQECIDAVNKQADDLQAFKTQCNKEEVETDKRLDSQGAILLGLEESVGDTKKKVAHLFNILDVHENHPSVPVKARAAFQFREDFSRLTFIGRVKWLLTGRL